MRAAADQLIGRVGGHIALSHGRWTIPYGSPHTTVADGYQAIPIHSQPSMPDDAGADRHQGQGTDDDLLLDPPPEQWGCSVPQVDEPGGARLTEAAVCLLGTTSHFLAYLAMSDAPPAPARKKKAARDLPDRSATC